jgi:hypothetical protein
LYFVHRKSSTATMSIISSPSPNLSPKTSFHGHDRSYVGLRRSNSRFSSATRHSHASTSPADSSFHQTPRSPAFPAPMKTMTDSGTQYTPEEYPPTASRQRISTLSPAVIDTPMENDGPLVKQEEESVSAIAQIPPPEPTMRDDPQPHSPEDRLVTGQGTVRNGVSSASTPDLGSPSKRARGPKMEDKIMPRDYMKCDVKDLGHVIADMLMELVRINDPLPFKNSNLTRFHSR